MPERSQVTTPKRRWITSTYGETLRREKIIKRPTSPERFSPPPAPSKPVDKEEMQKMFFDIEEFINGR